MNCVEVKSDPLRPLPNPITDRACAEVKIMGGATRTPGFWMTHLDYTTYVFYKHLGGMIDLGWKKLDSIEDVMGMFWASNTFDSHGIRRDKLCQARVTVSFQAVAAILNSGLDNGAPLPVSPADIAKIRALGALLDAYNNSGDDIAIVDNDGYPILPANPRGARAIADIRIADCK